MARSVRPWPALEGRPASSVNWQSSASEGTPTCGSGRRSRRVGRAGGCPKRRGELSMPTFESLRRSEWHPHLRRPLAAAGGAAAPWLPANARYVARHRARRGIPRHTRTIRTRVVGVGGPPAPSGEDACEISTDDSDVGHRDAAAERHDGSAHTPSAATITTYGPADISSVACSAGITFCIVITNVSSCSPSSEMTHCQPPP